MESVEAVVIGAGVVGLACARALAERGVETIILERARAIGTESSARNSEVIHAGLHYPKGSLKERLCVTGRRQLYAYCDTHGVAYRRCGKLIVATADAQQDKLRELQRQGRDNGVDDLRYLDAAAVRTLEPELTCRAALLSPSTGIIDSRGLMIALLGDAERAGALLALRSPMLRGRITSDDIVIEVGGATTLRCRTRILVNAAGAWAQDVAASLHGFPTAQIPLGHYAKGHYFALNKRAPFSRLVYPLPERGGLGIHLTLDLAGQARFGPDVEWLADRSPNRPIADFDYRVDPTRAAAFYDEIRRYWPALPEDALTPAYAGVRSKIAGRSEATGDFVIQGPAQHGICGLVNLFGIESPGLTASLAIGERVVAAVRRA